MLSLLRAALSMKSYICFVVLSCLSKRVWFSESCQKKVKYTIPIDSQKLPIYFPAQFIMCVTLFATTNSKSYTTHAWSTAVSTRQDHLLLASHWGGRKTYLSWEFIANEEPIFYFDSTYHILRHHHHLLLGLRLHHLLHVVRLVLLEAPGHGGMHLLLLVLLLVQFMHLKVGMDLLLVALVHHLPAFRFLNLTSKNTTAVCRSVPQDRLAGVWKLTISCFCLCLVLAMSGESVWKYLFWVNIWISGHSIGLFGNMPNKCFNYISNHF